MLLFIQPFYLCYCSSNHFICVALFVVSLLFDFKGQVPDEGRLQSSTEEKEDQEEQKIGGQEMGVFDIF